MKKSQTATLKDIPDLAKTTAKFLKGGEIFALTGNLGAGKTAFVKALGKELKLRHKITSPTFTLLNVFPLKIKGKELFLYHLDVYRCKNFKEVKALGLTEIWGKKNTVTLIEWADKIKKHLPAKTTHINFKNL